MTSFSKNPADSWDRRVELLHDLKTECAREIHLGNSGNKSKFVIREAQDTFTVSVHAPIDPDMSPAERWLRKTFTNQQQMREIGSLTAKIGQGENALRVISSDIAGNAQRTSFSYDPADDGVEAYRGAEEIIGNWILHMSALNVPPVPPQPVVSGVKSTAQPA